MILTGQQIKEELKTGNIIISPFIKNCIEPNSYGFHLGNDILEYDNLSVDALNIKQKPDCIHHTIPEEGFLLEQGKFYLGSTMEKMGSKKYAETLHADFSTSSMGMWIQFSASLGHVGSIINWTLEIMVTQPLLVYPHMRIGKLAFWKPMGTLTNYHGKYVGSDHAVASRIYTEY